MNSKYDGDGIKSFGRPPVKVIVLLDISGSMGCPFQEGEVIHLLIRLRLLSPSSSPFSSPSPSPFPCNWLKSRSKLEVAKESLFSILDQLKQNDHFGLVLFNTVWRRRRRRRGRGDGL
jgi:hypothetical protein